MQVRGTPASGKTVLARLLADHISQQDPDVNIVWIDGWPQRAKDNYRSYLEEFGWVEHEKTVFIFDDAQLTYEDPQLWNAFFKSMHDYKECRAILFASYGSPMSRIGIKGTNMVTCDAQRVTLRHVAHEDRLEPAGLLFTRNEFNDLVLKNYLSSEYYFHPDFFDPLFDLTNGHVGAIRDFTNIIIADDSYRKLKGTGKLYTWNAFLAEVSPRELLQKLENSARIFKKGLPSDFNLQAPATARIFSAVLRNNVVMDADFSSDNDKDALRMCFLNGWLHADKLEDTGLPGYFFPSPLHRWYVEWKLSDSLPPTELEPSSLLNFVIGVIHLFSPRLLSSERRIGPSFFQRRPEAQYQDEMYRCCHVLSNGSLITFPEFGTARGRVDFYIPAKSWGIELLCDGNQMASHCGRFSDETGSYRTTLPLSDYIVIDCRTTRPRERHPNMSNLFHAVFEDNFQNVYILDNMLHPVSGGDFQLLMTS